MSESIRTATFEDLMTEIPQERIEQSRAYWDGRTLQDVMGEMPPVEHHVNADIVVVQPDSEDVDATSTLVLPLEFTQGYSAPHYMRAKVLQQLVAPNSRVVIMPNSTFGTQHVDIRDGLSDSEKKQLSEGNYMPYGKLLMRALEEADTKYSFGSLSLVGSSQAGTSVLSIAAAGSDRIDEINSISAIEVPSKTDRGIASLALDFMKSGGDLSASVRESEIPAQEEAMKGIKLLIDLGKFATRPFVRESRLIARAMTGSVEPILQQAIHQLPDGSISLMHVEDSKVFDPESLSPEVERAITQIKLVGEFAHGHSTPNNLRFNAAMAFDGSGQ